MCFEFSVRNEYGQCRHVSLQRASGGSEKPRQLEAPEYTTAYIILRAASKLRKGPAVWPRGLCFVLSATLFFHWDELSTELAFTSQRAALLVTPCCVSWNITVAHLHFEIQPILSKMSLSECNLVCAFKSITFAYQALGDKSGLLIFTGDAENILVYMRTIT